MAHFRYRARSGRGELVEGRLEAATVDAVAAQLLGGGITPIAIEACEEEAGESKSFGRLLTHRRPDLAALTLLCRQMHTLLRSGVPIVRGMRSLAESSGNPLMVEVLEEVTTNLETGRDLSSCLARYPDIFSPLFRSMIQVGENTGRLDEAFIRLAAYLELERNTRERIKAALRYPSFVIGAIALAIGIINVYVIPAFANVFERSQVELPWATRMLIGVSDLFVTHWVSMIAILAIVAIAVVRYVRTDAGRLRWDSLKLRLPVIGVILRRATLARFARSFSLCSRAGVPILQTLGSVARAVDNRFVGERVEEMRKGIERGDTLTRTATATGLFTPLVLQMLAIGEETGAVDELLEEVADFYEREVDNDIKNLSASIEPILVVAVGIMVLILALGVFLPMWDLATGVGMR